MAKNISITCIIPDLTDGTSFYRGIGPLSHIKRYSDLNVSLFFPDQVNDALLLSSDIVFMQRPFSPQHLQVAEMAQLQSKPLWLDYDDDLFNVDVGNPTYHLYGKSAVKNNIKTLIEMADVITVSTEHLATKIRAMNDKVIVINNGLDLSLFKYRKPNLDRMDKNDLVMWRGSPTHTKDVLSVANQILQVHDERPDTIFEFIGDRMWLLTEQMKANQFIHTEWTTIMKYKHHIYSRTPKAFIVPLMFSDFNRSKSNIGWLEASFAGSLTIAPMIPEFEQPGVFTYKTQEGFKDALDQVLYLNETDHLYHLENTWKHILEHYTLDTLNEKRINLIKGLL